MSSFSSQTEIPSGRNTYQTNEEPKLEVMPEASPVPDIRDFEVEQIYEEEESTD